MAKKWEYKVVSLEDQSEGAREKLLNALGQEGWELVTIRLMPFSYSLREEDPHDEPEHLAAYLKREIP